MKFIKKFASSASLCLCCMCIMIMIQARAASAASFVAFPTSWDVGQAFVVSITSDAPYTNPTVKWQNATVKLDVEKGGDGYISYGLLGSHSSNIKPGSHAIRFEFTQNNKRYRADGKITLRSHPYPSENLTVSPKMVNPPKSELERIRKEGRLTSAARKTMTTKRRWTTPPDKPLPAMTVTSHYGFHRVFNGTPRSPHAATDLRAAVGTKVTAPFAGTVILTGNHYYAGGSVYIDSGNGVITMFFHLNKILVKKGDVIKKGQVIALSGATGRITGPHLHYGLSLAGQYVDPMPLFNTSVHQLLKSCTRAQVN